ncbi:MAG: hypothetical protein ABI475_03080 [Methylophilaceae bacterium]
MKKLLVCIVTAYLMAAIPAYAAVAPKSGNTSQVKHGAAKQQPSAMHKAGSQVKSGWHKLTASVKKGSKTHACNDAQRSLK